MGFGTRRIVCIRFRAEPSCPHFISEAGVQCAASCIDAVKEAYFHGRGVHGLYGDFHIVDEVVGVSFGKAYVPAVFFVFGASHDMAEGEFGDAGFPAADEVIGPGLYGPVVSVAVVTQCESVPSSGDGVGNALPSGSFFVSVPGAVCISADAEEVIGIEEPVYSQGGVPLDAFLCLPVRSRPQKGFPLFVSPWLWRVPRLSCPLLRQGGVSWIRQRS